MINRRQFLKLGAAAGAALAVPVKIAGTQASISFLAPRRVLAASQMGGLSDPQAQPKFVNLVPDALAPGFKYAPDKANKNKATFTVGVGLTSQWTGLMNGGTPVSTPLFGYGQGGSYSWPGKTFEVQSGKKTEVRWTNDLGGVAQHLLPVDTSLHWAYSLMGYEQYSIAANGIPVVAHLHGGHTNYQFDGNPEYFFSPGFGVRGPRWMDEKYSYKNDQPAGNLWYHDHALGITRLNVYAGMAGFYFVRDNIDTGLEDNPLGLPAWPYEKAYAIQDRMFWEDGRLFYPAYPDEPFYDDFITDEGAILPPGIFPDGGPTALAEFFGDHMVVNGMIWPKEDVKPRNYRLRLLNGTDSRFLVIRFRQAATPDATDLDGAGAAIPFWVIGSDQGLASAATQVDRLVFEPGSRYDIVFDFKGLQGKRIIMENIGGDEPFGGDIPGPRAFDETDRIMAFDVEDIPNMTDAFNPANIGGYAGNANPVARVRKVALFEGKDEFGRLQPLLGTAEPATDYLGNPINWPDMPAYANAGLAGPMQGSIPWHSPTTENPALGDTEIWEIYNATGDAHPVHLHLVNFQVGTGDPVTYGVTRQAFTADVIGQPVVQHNGAQGNGFRLENIQLGNPINIGPSDGYVENAPKDMVTALPDQVTRIKATFDKPGRYVWHCHILSHEDHEMMRVLHVGPGA